MTDLPIKSDTQAALDFVSNNLAYEVVKPVAESRLTMLLVPRGMEAVDVTAKVDALEERPRRLAGTTALNSVDSFTAWVNRNKTPHSAIYADITRDPPAIVAVIDHPTANPEAEGWKGAAWGRFRGAMALKLSEPWNVWTKADGAYKAQDEFAEFIEDRFGDLLCPPGEYDTELTKALGAVGAKAFADPIKMREVSKGLELAEGRTFKSRVNLTTGETQIVFQNTLTGQNGEDASVLVPQAFLVALPVFEGTAPFRVPVRLRIKPAGGAVLFSTMIHRPDLVLEAAKKEALEHIRKTCEGVEVFEGTYPQAG